MAAKNLAVKFGEEKAKPYVLHLAEILMYKTEKSVLPTNENSSKEIQFLNGLISGYQSTYAVKRNSLEAFKNFSEALKIAEQLDKSYLIKAALIGLLDLFSSEIFIGGKQYAPYLERFIELKSDLTDETLIIMYSLIFFSKADDNVNAVDSQYYKYYERLDSIFALFPKSHDLYPRYYYEKGIFYKIEEDFKKAEDFFVKADSLSLNKPYLESFRGDIAWQLASLHMQNNKLQQAKNYLKVSNNFSSKLRDTFYNDRLASLIFQKEGNTDSAYYYLRKSVDIEYRLGYKNNTLESSILTVQNQTDKLKLDALELDAQNRKNRNLAIALGLLLVFGSAIAFLVNSNAKRKQLVAEQQKTLQEQKVITLLKEQELNTIDAMIEGQEKERQRIANDLHDDLGGLMANVKLLFNSLQPKIKDDVDKLYSKTNALIDEAYHKIRAIAHAKNSGVIAKQGLLKAVEHMAEKVSAANNITIEVKDFGLDNRLENSLEHTLFRIIQELITNIIKHSNATYANIHITNHGDALNIMVEDNGVGFQSDKIISKSTGMGLKSIDKRVAHLEGTLHIESEIGKGATVIIDIPI
ncbi:sensor histidine kinase [Muricauda sp. CAU 1633]|uniref:sensor histidine kinase n=1 Tax=Allomuricauda sp. CAU 1633 TaxID=2816036 RepID=UPI001A8CACF2|nr:sensor histidine kinase [Muricauda sp. CAU 1633]MBO0323540.1 sensor histidine kinase [Muricauda sp. CAU 1633]